MLRMLVHKGNANQNDTEILTHTTQKSYHNNTHNLQMLKRMWGKATLIYCWWTCKLMQVI
jgi:hypothetical protein